MARMGLRGRFDRWVFITETRLKVAYHNYVVERAFVQRGASLALPFPVSPQLTAGVLALILLMVGGAAFIARMPAVAALPSVAMPVISNANFRRLKPGHSGAPSIAAGLRHRRGQVEQAAAGA